MMDSYTYYCIFIRATQMENNLTCFIY